MSDPAPYVLVVEADPVERDLIRLAMTRLRLATTWVATGEDALAAIRAQIPALVLLDLFLPRQNGLDLLVQLRAAGVLALLPVIAISSLGFPEIVQQAVEAGARDFLVKPMDTDILIDKVAKILAPLKAINPSWVRRIELDRQSTR